MTSSQNSPQNKALTPANAGMLKSLVLQAKLVWRLMGDSRVNIFAKFLPILSVGYFFWPMDAIPGITLPVIGALDDAAILWLGFYLFLELCPPEAVQEHSQALGLVAAEEGEEEVVDAEVTEITDETP